MRKVNKTPKVAAESRTAGWGVGGSAARRAIYVCEKYNNNIITPHNVVASHRTSDRRDGELGVWVLFFFKNK